MDISKRNIVRAPLKRPSQPFGPKTASESLGGKLPGQGGDSTLGAWPGVGEGGGGFFCRQSQLELWRVWRALTDATLARKEFLHVATQNVHLKGIGGPGAPHAFSLKRRQDVLGVLSRQLS